MRVDSKNSPKSMDRTSWRRLAVLAVGVVAMVVLSGCITMNLDVDLNSDGSGRLTFETVIPQELAAFMEMTGESMDEKFIRDEFLEGMPRELADRVDLSVVRSGDEVSIKVDVRFTDLDELTVAMAGGPDSNPLFTEFELRKEPYRWVFSATPVDLSTATGMDLGGALGDGLGGGLGDGLGGGIDSGPGALDDDIFGSDDLPDGMSDMFNPDDLLGNMFREPEAYFTIRFPGKVMTSNADQVSGRTAKWDLSGSDVRPLEATAAIGGGMSLILIGALIGVVAVLMVGGVLMIRRSRSTAGSVDGDSGSGLPGGGVGFQQVPSGPPGPPGPLGSTGATRGTGGTRPTGAAALWEPSPSGLPPLGSAPTFPTSPPVSPTTPPAPLPEPQPEPQAHATTAGWYPDPWHQAQWRWHDGTEWTNHTS